MNTDPRLKDKGPEPGVEAVPQVRVLATPDLAAAGTKVGDIPLYISYKMIDVFSGHLYSYPSKAIEELVANSYDAFARRCHVVVPENLDEDDARVTVWDDGESMDLVGLGELWRVAESRKREPDRERAAQRRGRLPVGKFGVGKLASYVLGRRITHVCRRGDEVLLVTVDFGKVVEDTRVTAEIPASPPARVDLPVRRVGTDEAATLLASTAALPQPSGKPLPLFGLGSPSRWTLAIVDRLKPAARTMARGRLRWVISTALPLVPDFRVYLNGERILPSKSAQPYLRTWTIGRRDETARRLGYSTGSYKDRRGRKIQFIDVPGVGRVHGQFTLYKDSLLGGKAEEMGRSHGFFVMVRGRLVNHDDPLFGTHPLSMGTFNRLRAEIHADGLDDSLVVSRESVGEGPSASLRSYLTAKFHELQSYFEVYSQKGGGQEAFEERVLSVPAPLARFPLERAFERAKASNFRLSRITVPPKDKPAHPAINAFEYQALDPTEPFAKLDGSTGTLVINTNHPVYQNFAETDVGEVFGVAEVVLEAYLAETPLEPEQIDAILTKRDDLLRLLVYAKTRSVVLIASNLTDATHSPEDLENACHAAFRALGFAVTPLGQSGQPDGLASGVKPGEGPGDSRTFVVAYDAKSTLHDRAKSGNLQLSGVKRHRVEHGADYSIVIAPDFQDARGDDSKAVQEARQQGVTLIRVRDFAELVRLSGAKPFPLSRFEELLRGCRSPKEASEWVAGFKTEESSQPDLPLILETIQRLQLEDKLDSPTFQSIRFAEPRLKQFSSEQLGDWVRSMSRIAPELVFVYGDRAGLNQSAENVLAVIRERLSRLRGMSGAARL